MCQEKILKYTVATSVVTVSGFYDQDPLCNGLAFKNNGTSVAVVKGAAVQPGESFQLGGNRGEVFTGRVDISFVAGGANALLVVEKYYLSDCL